jgi:gamma-glutamyltranspeptidase/glutathione hydrolase
MLRLPVAGILAAVALLAADAAGAETSGALRLSTCAEPPAAQAPACHAARGVRASGWPEQGRSEVIARHGMVSTSQPLAAEAGLGILRRGGNAIDAAVAAAAALNVVEPYSAGMGGDLFAIVYLAREHRLIGLNASGWSGSAATPERLQAAGHDAKSGMPEYGILTVDVPGAVDGWAELLKRGGSRKMAEVLAPAIELASEGFPWSERIAHDLTDSYTENAGVAGDADTRATYYPDGRMPRAGQLFRNPGLARALRAIAVGGRDAFYKGDIARAIVAKSRALGGALTRADLAEFHAEWVEPISTRYHGFDVFELPPNGQGFAVLEELNILEACAPNRGGRLEELGPASPTYWHLLIEAKKLAFADLARFNADPRFSKVPLERLLSKAYAASLCDRIDPKRATPPAVGADVGGGTVYLASADRFGNMVSLIYSVYDHMGSGLTVPGYGFVLQNRGALFSLDPSSPNVIAPRKRPFHTIIPGFVMKDGQPLMAFGLMGGAMQAQGHMQVLVDLIDLGANLQAAGDSARFQHFQGRDVVALETPLYNLVGKDLAALGHRVEPASGAAMGGYQSILFVPDASAAMNPPGSRSVAGSYRAGSDHRRDGAAVGW